VCAMSLHDSPNFRVLLEFKDETQLVEALLKTLGLNIKPELESIAEARKMLAGQKYELEQKELKIVQAEDESFKATLSEPLKKDRSMTLLYVHVVICYFAVCCAVAHRCFAPTFALGCVCYAFCPAS
jgi:hypothetical protein